MIMKKIISSLAIIALVSSCVNEMEDNTITGDYNSKIKLTAKPFVLDDGGAATRSFLSRTETSLKFSWKDGEAIGVFPVNPTTNIQAKKTISVTGQGSLSADFDGAGWELKRGNSYSAYSPFNGTMPSETPYTSVPINMTGQAQNGNGSLAHIGDKYDYMYASSVVPTEGNVNFEFDHACAIAILDLTMPVAGTWTEATLTAESDVFTTSATMNVSTGAVTPVIKSSSISLALTDVITTAEDRIVNIYMSVLPCTTGALTLKVKNSDSKEYTATLVSKTLMAGRAYKWTASPARQINMGNAPAGTAAVDLGLSVRWANINVGATTATGYGTYFAWGEVTGCQRGSDGTSCIPATMDGYPSSWIGGKNSNYVSGNSKTMFGWSSYKWGDSNSNFYKYVKSSSNGTVDRTTLESVDDAAVVNWGGDWRMPTFTEQVELFNNCYWVYTSSYNGSDINGYIVYKAKNTSDKGVKVTRGETPSGNYSLADNHIFLPFAGYRYGDKFYNDGKDGNIWTSSFNGDISNSSAYALYFFATNVENLNAVRFWGFSVRAVCE